ncbi:hypothetical protein SAMN06265784_10480 [Paraburkholderia susongensis]|uniref:Uncharacterized protein n=1 Tax=Paraburkholderia susongensis TaxID=1515439 RepID=A0A1X7KN08_9BURK|nr:hypothetical protein SAMN06265784_10480 [Paraburkholderia susongensis]
MMLLWATPTPASRKNKASFQKGRLFFFRKAAAPFECVRLLCTQRTNMARDAHPVK